MTPIEYEMARSHSETDRAMGMLAGVLILIPCAGVVACFVVWRVFA